ncbi:hypothetical protein B0920_02070 [Massilia sp. KIM]|uniref:hypothetical protein n=1 Tax=Massilia sp. KIM TaxID=1955422 RepID=UPI00098F54B5|nr:hypothetical protein [Massilia sp. KIM]OON62287.1 hypothetical protein B0920_02070 [Massilia sp. KIM]
MPKKAQAAQAQDGGKVEEKTAPGSVNQAATGEQVSGSSQTLGETADASTKQDAQNVLAAGASESTSAATQQPNSGTLPEESAAAPPLDAATQAGEQAGSHTSSGNSSSDAAAGSGESFDKIAAAVFPSTPGLKVTSKQAGFRRAGRAWSTTPIVIALSELTQEQAEALLADPMLVVDLVDLDDDGEDF